MTSEKIRQLQHDFLACLETNGFFRRVKDGMAYPLFGKDSPTAVQLSMRLYPKYINDMQEYLDLYGPNPKCKSTKQGRSANRSRKGH